MKNLTLSLVTLFCFQVYAECPRAYIHNIKAIGLAYIGSEDIEKSLIACERSLSSRISREIEACDSFCKTEECTSVPSYNSTQCNYEGVVDYENISYQKSLAELKFECQCQTL